ncbi:MAG: histidine phosphatase family protein [Sorangiineae bacterium]|nr:histidine phosphatase family protein [Sorangiineae bacterium]
MRHAKASPDGAAGGDLARPLSPRGLKTAPRVGAQLREAGLTPDRVLASPSVRTLETARAVSAECHFLGPIAALDSLYLAEPRAYVAALARLPREVLRPLVVGHNPGLEQLITLLTGRGEHLNPGALAVVDVELADWTELSAETHATLRALWRPNEAD